MIKELIKKIKEIYNLLEDKENILVYGYVGSVSKGFADKYSDLDIVVICKNKPDYNKIYSQIKKIDSNVEKFIVEGEKMDYHFPYKGTTATIAFKTKEEIEKDIESLNSEFDYQIFKKVYSLHDYEVLFGNPEIIKNFQKNLPKEIPNKYIVENLPKTYQWIINNIKEGGRLDVEIARESWISFNYRINRTIGWLIELIYLINGLPFQDARWFHREINSMKLKPQDFIKRLNKIVSLGSNKKEADRKLKLLRELVVDLNKIIKKKFPKAEVAI